MSDWTDADVEEYYRKHPDVRRPNSTLTDAINRGKEQIEQLNSATPKPSKMRNHPEKDLEQFVHDTARACRLMYYHTYRSRFSEPGFPDCIILGKWMLVAELKDTGKQPTEAQCMWLMVFRSLKIDTRIWRPEDKDEIVSTLAKMRVI